MPLSKLAGSNTLTLRLAGSGTCTIDWGHGSTEVLTLTGSSTEYTKVYPDTTARTFSFTAGAANITRWEGGTDNISGDLADLPRNLTHFDCYGSNTISGALSSLPASLTRFECYGDNTISGALSDLPTSLTSFACYGDNTISGALSDLPTGLAYFACSGSNTISGSLSSLPTSLTYAICEGNNTVSGPLNDTVETLQLRTNSNAQADDLVKSIYNRVIRDTHYLEVYLGCNGYSLTDGIQAIADILIGNILSSYFEIYNYGTPVETNDSLSYWTLLGQPPYQGFFPVANGTHNNLIKAESTQLTAGPEPTNTVAPVASFAANLLSCTTGTWENYSNGTPTTTYQWQRLSGSWGNVSGATSSTLTPPLAGDYRCIVTRSNGGGAGVPANSNEISTALLSKLAGSNTLTLRLAGSGTCTIDWGHGSPEVLTLTGSPTNFTKVYPDTTARTFSFTEGAANITQWQGGTDNISGDLADLPRNLTRFACYGGNTISGALSGLPASLTNFDCQGSNTISGALSGLPASLTEFECRGDNTISGALSGLPASLTSFACRGDNTISGALSGLPTGLAYFACIGGNTISGSLSSLPASLGNFICYGSNTILGPLNDTVEYLEIRADSNAQADDLVKSVYNRVMREASYIEAYLDLNGYSLTDGIQAIADILNVGLLDSYFEITDYGTPVQTNDSLSYWTLLGQPPYQGFFPVANGTHNNLIKAESTQLTAGPEPTNTVAPVASFAANRLSCTTGMWENYSNGTPTTTYQWQRLSGSWGNVSGATSSTLTPTLAGDYRCVVTRSNDGGSHLASNSNTVAVVVGYHQLKIDHFLVGRWASIGSDNLTESVTAATEVWNGTGAYLPKPTAPPAVEGNSFSLTGSNYIQVGNLGVTSNTVTYCGWVYDDSSPGTFDPVFYDRNVNCGLHTSIDGTRWGYSWNGLDWGWGGGPTRSPGEWVYIALRVNGPDYRISIRTRSTSGTVKFAENIAGAISMAYAPNLMIGADTVLPDRRFVGRLNDLRIYNRLLTDEELDDIALGAEPINTIAPVASFSGSLSCTTGTWNDFSNPTISYAYQWQSFSGSWSNIVGATASTYAPTLDGDYRCIVTATNGGGSYLPSNSNTVTVTLGPPPTFTNKIGPISKSQVQAGVAIGTSDATTIETLVTVGYGDASKLSISAGKVLLTDATPKSYYKFILADELIVVNVIENKFSYLNSETDTLAQTVASSLYSFPSVNKGLNPMSGANYSGRFKGGSK